MSRMIDLVLVLVGFFSHVYREGFEQTLRYLLNWQETRQIVKQQHQAMFRQQCRIDGSDQILHCLDRSALNEKFVLYGQWDVLSNSRNALVTSAIG